MSEFPKTANRRWTLELASAPRMEPDRKRIIYIETYGGGSHLRIAHLLQAHSAHALDILRLEREHWRWLALTAHRTILDFVWAHQNNPPDALVLSGPLDAARLLGGLPDAWRRVPVAMYFHESQWTYPGQDFDRRPYLVAHLEALEAVDEVWFNSRHHRTAFHCGASSNRSRRVRTLASEVLASSWHKTHVVYPPVHVDARPGERGPELRIVWAARWEAEKRPDVFAAAILRCADAGIRPVVHVLGGANSSNDPPEWLRELQPFMSDESGYLSRAAYEAVLSTADVWVSTSEHDFFGVAALEAAMLGAIPVLPFALAYPETLPSAIFYPSGDHEALAGRILSVAGWRPGPLRPWTIDADRFTAMRAGAAFDARCERLKNRRGG